jgi:hypothetical protein
MVDELAICLGFVADGLPFGVDAEGLPVGGGGFTAGMLKDVNESFAFKGIIGRGPVGEAFHVVLIEEGDGVIAEATEEIVELAFVDVVDAEFVDGRGGWHDVLFVRTWFSVADGPCGGGQQRGCGQGLQERAAVHEWDSSRGNKLLTLLILYRDLFHKPQKSFTVAGPWPGIGGVVAHRVHASLRLVVWLAQCRYLEEADTLFCQHRRKIKLRRVAVISSTWTGQLSQPKVHVRLPLRAQAFES